MCTYHTYAITLNNVYVANHVYAYTIQTIDEEYIYVGSYLKFAAITSPYVHALLRSL